MINFQAVKKIIDFLKYKVTSKMYAWGVIMILELIYMGVGIYNLIMDSSSKGDRAAVISAVCVLMAGILSIRRELKPKH